MVMMTDDYICETPPPFAKSNAIRITRYESGHYLFRCGGMDFAMLHPQRSGNFYMHIYATTEESRVIATRKRERRYRAWLKTIFPSARKSATNLFVLSDADIVVLNMISVRN